MGAYGIGSIERLCQIAPAHHGIITAVGYAHYERFRTIENVAQAKFELAHNVVKNSGDQGIILVHGENVPKALIPHTLNVISVGNDSDNQYQISDIKYTKNGVSFTLSYQDQSYKIQSPLYGMHHVDNIAICFVMAHKLNIDTKTILASLKSMPPNHS